MTGFKTAILLLIQLALQVGLYGLNQDPFGFNRETANGLLSTWVESMELFAIPFCLILFSFSKKILFYALKFAWGAWVATISFLLLGKATIQFPQINELGLIFVAFVGVLSFSLALLSMFQFLGQISNLRKSNTASVQEKGSLEKAEDPKSFPKVEGA